MLIITFKCSVPYLAQYDGCIACFYVGRGKYGMFDVKFNLLQIYYFQR